MKVDYAATGYQLKIKSVDINETESTNLVAIPDGHKLYHINVGPANLELADNLYYYEVSVIDSDNAYIAQPYRFYIEYRPIYSSFDLVYVNSLSGIDFIRAKGEFALTIERTYDESEGGLNVNDATSYVKPHESAQVAITGRKSYKGDIGFLRNKKQQEALNDVLYSTHIYMAVDERWVPLQNITKTQELGTTNDKNKSYPIEWTLSETNEVFTPEKILLGNMVDDEVYLKAPPTNLAITNIVTSGGDIGGSATITFSFTLPEVTGTGYVMLVTNEDALTTATTDPFTTTVNVVRGANYSFKIRVKYADGSFSEWSNIITQFI